MKNQLSARRRLAARWGGRNDPGRNMYSPRKPACPTTSPPAPTPAVEFKPGTEEIETNNLPNVKWIAKVGSQSYGNVVVPAARFSSAPTTKTRATRSTRATAAS